MSLKYSQLLLSVHGAGERSGEVGTYETFLWSRRVKICAQRENEGREEERKGGKKGEENVKDRVELQAKASSLQN